MIDSGLSIPISRQCDLLGVPRSSYYHQPLGVSEYDLSLMKEIEQIHLKHPYYGYRRIRYHLKESGFCVNGKRVLRLMQRMHIRSVLPRKRMNLDRKEHIIAPYLLKNKIISKPNEAWAMDITYILMPKGFMYLAAVLDWYSRFVLGWEISNSLENYVVLQALDKALALYNKPNILNTDQGSQFTSHDFQNKLGQHDIQPSMDGKGRAIDNIFIERLWWSVKYENIFLNCYETPKQLREGLSTYFQFYNHKRAHQALQMKTPYQVYRSPGG